MKTTTNTNSDRIATPELLRLPTRPGRSRWLLLGLGTAVFFWLRLEDNAPLSAGLLGGLSSVVWAGFWFSGRFGGITVRRRTLCLIAAVMGAATGVGAALLTAFLMFFKNASHAHLYPDYPVEIIAAILQRTPAWALAGVLAALGGVLIWIALGSRVAGDHSPEPSSPAN